MPLVQDFGGFDFLRNPFQDDTHLFQHLNGLGVCVSPEEGKRFKYQTYLRQATGEEAVWYGNEMSKKAPPTLDKEDDVSWYN